MADLASIIRDAARKYGVPPDVMLRIAQIESGMNPNAANPKSSARGVYQFMTGPGGSWSEYGRGANPLDPHANVDAGARYIRDNMNTLRNKLGREPLGWETYLAHQQGRAGAPALIANPNQPAASVLAPFYKNPATARQAVALNAGNPDAPAQAFLDTWKAKYEGGAVPSSGPPVAAGAAPLAAPEGSPPVTNPAALVEPGGLGGVGLSSVFADMLKPPAKPVDPNTLVRKPKKTMSELLGDLGAPVELSA